MCIRDSFYTISRESSRLKEERGVKREARGELKIFFGYAAGAGKTYAMLEEARAVAKSGVDVVVGVIDPHTRPETMALLEGMEVLPPLKAEGAASGEFDLDAALKRKPELILVDELCLLYTSRCV